ncbi:replication factor A [Halomicroarcula sp. GCM10025710]
MSESDLRTNAVEIHEQFSDQLDIEVEDVVSRLETLVDDYQVPLTEARRSVVNTYLDEAGMDREQLGGGGGGNDQVQVSDVDAPEEWVDMRVTVVELWEPRADAVAQVGLLGDETGTIKFTKWSKSDLPELEEEPPTPCATSSPTSTRASSRWLNRTTVIEELDEAIEVGDDSVEVEGALVDIQSGSGLIKRCPEDDCTRVLQNGRCSEHGEVEGEFDLRIKGVLDDGEEVTEVIFDEEATESLTGITLAEAKEMAMDALDTTVVADEMRQKILGRYYRVTGPTFRRYVLADEQERLTGTVDAEGALIKARSI